LLASPANKKPLSSLPAGAVQPKGTVLQITLGLLRRKIKLDPVGRSCLDRPPRRLHAPLASAAPGCAVPASGPPDCLRKLRQTVSVASFDAWPLRYRPRSATAPLAPENGAKGLRLRRRQDKQKARCYAGLKTTLGGTGYCVWWRRRGSNPRPQELHFWLYMLSPLIAFANRCPTGEGPRRTSLIALTRTGTDGTRAVRSCDLRPSSRRHRHRPVDG